MQEHTATTRSGREVTVRFAADEYAGRLAATRAELQRRDLAALLVFAQESHYYLQGFDTSGYVFFQVGVIPADERNTVLLTRRPDLHQAETTSLYDEVLVWLNAEDADPARDLKAVLVDLGLVGRRVGLEYATHGLTGANAKRVEAALDGFCTLVDASDIVRRQRLVKSEAELAYVAKAGELCDAATRAMIEATAPGVLDSALAAAGLSAMLLGGGDVPSGGPLVNSGPRALFGRGIGGPRLIGSPDQVLVEHAASYCRYHVCTEHVLTTGPVDPRLRDMQGVVVEALEAILEAARPGVALGTLDDIHRQVLDAAGFATERFAACGYALGSTFRPTWMDVPPMIYSGNPLILEPGMVFFVHIMAPDRRTGLAAGIGQTFAITEGAPRVFSDVPLRLHER